MPFIANDPQQDDIVAEFTKFPVSCIARGIVGLAWEHKKAGQRKCLFIGLSA